MKDTKDLIFEWINSISITKSGKHVPVVFRRETVATKFNISIRQVERHLNHYITEGKIYRYKLYNNIFVYSYKELDMSLPMYIKVIP